VDRAVNFALRVIKVNAEIYEQRNSEDIGFYVETQFEKNRGEGEDNLLFLRGYIELSRANILSTFFVFDTVFV